MIIRPLVLDDIPLVTAWVVTIPLWQRYGLTVAKLSAQLTMALDSDLILTADADERVVGLAWCLPHGMFGRSAYLKMLGVRPDLAGLGIGAQLLNQLERLVSTRDLFLLTSDFNQDAQRFYSRQGYQQVGTLPGYVLPDVTELIFCKRVR